MVRTVFSRVLSSPFGFQLTCLTFLLFFILGFRPPYSVYSGQFGDMEFSDQEVFLALNELGFLENSVGVDSLGLRQISGEGGKKTVEDGKRNETIFYTVKPGDNVSTIAYKFNLKPGTILWANNLTAKETLSVEEKLKIPPVDGVYYTVKKHETLSEIAKEHGVESEKIAIYNGVKKSIIKEGQELFIPGAQKIYIAEKSEPVETPKKTSKYSFTYGRPGAESGKGLESIGFKLLRPTKGSLTQGYHEGHYALDIANKANSPIYAAADGVVRVAETGWNYGYGNYIIIDHGNGLETLYAHNKVLKVKEGQSVSAGQMIARMGNTGRVFGNTGIHLHFEFRIRGRKVNPTNYFQ